MAANAKRGPRIVIVDDDPGMNQAVERLLRAGGFDPVGFSSGEALLKSEAAEAADCLLLDIHLPGLSGFDLYRQLEIAGIHTPVIFITAYDDVDARARAEQCGASAYLTKPFSGRNVMSAINNALNKTVPPDKTKHTS